MANKILTIDAELEGQVQKARETGNKLGKALGTGINEGSKSVQMSAGSQKAMGSTLGGSEKELKSKLQVYKQIQETEGRALKEKKIQLLQILKIEGQLDKLQKEKKKRLREEIRDSKEKVRLAKDLEKTMSSSIPKPQATATGGGGGGGRGPGIFSRLGGTSALGGISGMSGVLRMLGGGGSAVGALMLAARSASNTIGYYGNRDSSILGSTSTSIANTSGMEFNAYNQGKGTEFSFWSKEREQAKKIAQKQVAAKQVQDSLSVMNPIKWMNSLGDSAGGALGFLAKASARGIGGLVLGKRKYAAAFDSEAYSKMNQAERDTLMNSNLDDLKKGKVLRSAGIGYFSRNKNRMLGLQRGAGLSDSDMFMGSNSILAQGAKGKFTDDIMLGNMQSLLQGGASSAMVRGGSLAASKLQRDYGMTNATSVLAKMSGTGMDVQESTDQAKRLMAEAVKLGVDTSKMPAETRKLADSMATMIYNTGGNVSAKMMAGGLSSDMTFRDIQSSQGSFNTLNKVLGTGSPLGRAKQWAYLNTKKGQEDFGGLGTKLQNSIIGMDLNDINEDNAFVKQYMIRKGKKGKPMDFKDAYKNIINLKKMGEFNSGTEVGKNLEDIFTGKTNKQVKDLYDANDPTVVNAIAGYLSTQKQENGINVKTIEQFTTGAMRGRINESGVSKVSQENLGDLQSQSDTTQGSLANIATSKQAAAQGASLKAVSDNMDRLGGSSNVAAEHIDQLSVKIKKSNENLGQFSSLLEDLIREMSDSAGRQSLGTH